MRAGGTPAIDAGDFLGSVDEYTFTALVDTPCVDVFIFADDLFEGDEDFVVEFQSFRRADGSTVSSLTGVTVRPQSTTVVIQDTNSKLNIIARPHTVLY